MKKFPKISILILSLLLLNYCAKPTVVDVIMPGDEKLNCGQLKDEYQETRRFKQEADAVKETNTGGNMTRTVLFWPALLKTLHNADIAAKAANDRAYHLVNIMKKKNCKEADKLFTEVTRASNSVYISSEIKKLNKLYKSGVLTKEEFTKAKKKVLDSND